MDSIITTVRGNVVTLENVTSIFWKNFSGKEDRFKNTSRKFTMGLDEETANRLMALGVGVKSSTPNVLDPDEESNYAPYRVQAKVNYKGQGRDPSVFMLRNDKKRLLNEQTISLLDWQYIEYADITFNLYHYDGNVSLYVMSAYFKLQDDHIADKYDDWELTLDEPYTEDLEV